MIKELIRIGSQFIGYREYASRTEGDNFFFAVVVSDFLLLSFVAIFDLSFLFRQRNLQRPTNVPTHLLKNWSKVRRPARKPNLLLAKPKQRLMKPKQKLLVSRNCRRNLRMLRLH
jgi:hypothetical protein